MKIAKTKIFASKFRRSQSGQAVSEYGATLTILSIIAVATVTCSLPGFDETIAQMSQGVNQGLNKMADGATHGLYM